ncbi:MAG TPA: DUF1624 domain-containing protein [Gammaproteobacteria bacterium]|nr:DUF1624 domain-containing protein [Gammaproteobacteria bacterium]
MTPQPAKSSPTKQRYPIIDVLRGLAILMMFSYHFSFDLNYFGFIQLDFYHNPFWLNYRTLIVSLFLGLVGVSLSLATRYGFKPRAYFRRLGWLIVFAILVSIVTYIQFSDRMIFFGILHFIALASVLGLAFIPFYWLNLVFGTGLVILGTQFQNAVFNQPWLQWIGLMTHKPFTEDYVPLLPWFGVVLLGIFIGKLVFQKQPQAWLQNWQSTHPFMNTLRFGGRHSLIIYMLHQPVFMGLLYLVSLVVA